MADDNAPCTETPSQAFAKPIAPIVCRSFVCSSRFVGTQVWKYKSRIKTKDVDRRDTLFISPAKKGNKISGGNEIDFNLHEEYRKATMKEKTDYYEITFTEPKDKEMPKKSIMRIRKSNYHFYEMESKQSGVSVRMTASKIKFGVSDNIFKLDMKKFPGATVIRK